MTKLYRKSELGFALAWIGAYVAVMNLALQFCGGFDDLPSKTPGQVAVPVVCILLLAVAAALWIRRSGLETRFGLCRFRGDLREYLWFLPLILLSCTNLKNGLCLPASPAVSVLMMVNLAAAGFVEEIIFRGFLFRAMEKDNLKSAVIVSAVTFGAGHIVNLANTADTLGVLLQVCYAIAIGFLYTVIVHRGGSLWPCILSHVFVNGTSVFAAEHGPYTELMGRLLPGPAAVQTADAVLIILLSGGYAWWLAKKSHIA